jgi:hypothetical protein
MSVKERHQVQHMQSYLWIFRKIKPCWSSHIVHNFVTKLTQEVKKRGVPHIQHTVNGRRLYS